MATFSHLARALPALPGRRRFSYLGRLRDFTPGRVRTAAADDEDFSFI
jgi:hypothetical protein